MVVVQIFIHKVVDDSTMRKIKLDIVMWRCSAGLIMARYHSQIVHLQVFMFPHVHSNMLLSTQHIKLQLCGFDLVIQYINMY